MTTQLDERIASAKEQLKKLQLQKRRADARQRSIELKTKRSEELRKKILIGTVILERIERGELAEAQLRQWMDPALTRPVDRALFGLNMSSGEPSSSAHRPV